LPAEHEPAQRDREQRPKRGAGGNRETPDVPNADQLLAKLYALRKDYADDPEDETYLALHHAFLFISYNVAAFKEYVKKEAEKE
jgi:hypothetical protein